MRVLVATITHRADDARIFARQIPALIEGGHQVTAVAPWKASSVTPGPSIAAVNVPRTRGRRRLWALLRGALAIWRRAKGHDVILVHDPELAIALSFTPLRKKTIWDVHEDLPASLKSKGYLAKPVRIIASVVATRIELFIEKRMHLILAEARYADRFKLAHPIIFNLPRVPATLSMVSPLPRVIYVGSITKARGLEMMLRMARDLERHSVELLLIGEIPSAEDREMVANARNVVWNGPMANQEALAEVERSLAGLSLLSDMPNYRHSMPTKILEYMSRGTPVISTPLALAQAALDEHGFIVSFDIERGAKGAVDAIIELISNPSAREQMRKLAFERVTQHYNWNLHQEDFVAALSEG